MICAALNSPIAGRFEGYLKIYFGYTCIFEMVKENLKTMINKTEIVDRKKIETMDLVIDPDEVTLFNFYG